MKKIVSILLVLTVLVNFVGFGVFNVRASAVVPLVAAILEVIKDCIVGTAIGGVSSAATAGVVKLNEVSGDFSTQVFIQRSTNDVNNGNLVDISLDSHNEMIFSVNSNCSSESREFAQRLVDRLNSLPGTMRWVDPDGTTVHLQARVYEQIKSDVVDEYMQYLSDKGAMEVVNAGIQSGEFPAYNFDWTNPSPGISLPTVTGYASLTTADGAYTLSAPMMITSDYRGESRFGTGNLDTIFGCQVKSVLGDEENGYYYGWGFDESKQVYGYGYYILFNGKIYYNGANIQANYATGGGYTRGIFTLSRISNGNFKSIDGEDLADAMSDSGISSIIGLRVGVYYINSPDVPREPTMTISEDDMVTTSGGGTIEIPRTDAENAIGAAIAAGIISDDPELTLDENGNITAADGIDLTTIEDLLRGLASDDVDLSSIEGYLASIRTLLANGNTKTDDIKRILSSVQSNIKDITALKTAVNGIKALEQSQVTSLANIEAQIAAITEALTAAKANNLDFDIPDVTIIDKFPFSLPWDFYNIISILCADPKEPIFIVPIKTTITNGGLNYDVDEEIVLDLTIFRVNGVDIVRAITNSATILLAVICLISMTRKFVWK